MHSSTSVRLGQWPHRGDYTGARKIFADLIIQTETTRYDPDMLAALDAALDHSTDGLRHVVRILGQFLSADRKHYTTIDWEDLTFKDVKTQQWLWRLMLVRALDVCVFI